MFKVICHLVIIYVAPLNDHKPSIVFLVQSMTHILFHLSKMPSSILEPPANAFREVLMEKKITFLLDLEG